MRQLVGLCAASLLVWWTASCAHAPDPAPTPALSTLTGDVQQATGATPIDIQRWQQATLRYRVEVYPLRSEVAVQMSVRQPPSPLPLHLPGAWAGLSDLRQVVKNIEVFCGESPLALEASATGAIQVEHQGCELLRVRYQMQTQRGEGLAMGARRARLWPRLHGQGLLVYGQTAWVTPWAGSPALLGPENAAYGDIAVEVVVPSRWSVSSSWQPVALDPEAPGAHRPQEGRALWTFFAQGPGDLRDSVVVAGELREHVRPLQDGRTLRLAVQGTLPVPEDDLLDAVQRLVAVQKRMLPTDWRWPRGTQQLSVIILGHEDVALLEGAGRRGGVVLELGSTSSREEVMELIAHEIFHVLNGHLLVPAAGEEYQTLWFKEGVTSYVALVSVLRARLVSSPWALERLGTWIGNYYGNPLSVRLPARKLGETYWRSPHARRLPYDKGALLALLLDLALWEEGQDLGTGVERWISALLGELRQQGGFCHNDLMKSMALVLSQDVEAVSTLWTSLIDGVEPLPLSNTLNLLGLSLSEEVRAAPYYGFGLAVDPDGTYVSSVDPAGPAASAGLRRGMRVMGRPDVDWMQPGRVAQLRVAGPGGRALKVLIQPGLGKRSVYVVRPSGGPGEGRWKRMWDIP